MRVYLDRDGNQVEANSPAAVQEWDDDDPAFAARYPDFKNTQQADEPAPADAAPADADEEPKKAPRKRS